MALLPEMLAALKTLASTPEGRESLKKIAEAHGIEGGRKWSEMRSVDVAILYEHSPFTRIAAEEDRKATGVAPWCSLSDDSEEGRAFNAKIPF